MNSKTLLFIVAFLVWLALTWIPDWQHLVIGVFVAGLVSFLMGDIFADRPRCALDIDRYRWFFRFIPVFTWEYIKANGRVIYRIVHPDIPIRPGIVKVKTHLRSAGGLTFLANSITLASGAFCVDVDKEKGFLYFHCIEVKDGEAEGATAEIAGRFENILGRIFE